MGKTHAGKSSALPCGALIGFLFMPTNKDNKQCTGNYNNYDNLITVMRMVMMSTVCFVQSNAVQTCEAGRCRFTVQLEDLYMKNPHYSLILGCSWR